MTTAAPHHDSSGAAPELVPVFQPGAELPLAAPQGGLPWVLAPMEELLADALFGDVIDISDLIPRLLSPTPLEDRTLASPFGDVIDLSDMIPRLLSPAPAGAAGQERAAEALLMDDADAAQAFGHATAFVNILYAEDDLSAGGTL